MDTKTNESMKEPQRENPSPRKSINDRDINQDDQKQITNTERDHDLIESDINDASEKKKNTQRNPSSKKSVENTEFNRNKKNPITNGDKADMIEDEDNDKKAQP